MRGFLVEPSVDLDFSSSVDFCANQSRSDVNFLRVSLRLHSRASCIETKTATPIVSCDWKRFHSESEEYLSA